MKKLFLTSLILSFSFHGQSEAATFCEAWSKYLQEVPPGLLSKDAVSAVKGENPVSKYRGSFKRTKNRDIECDTAEGCNFVGEGVSLTGAMKVSNELITSMPKDFSKNLKRFTDQVNVYQSYSKFKKKSASLDKKQKKLLQDIAAISSKGREIVVKQGLSKNCFSTYERDLNAKINLQAFEIRKWVASQAEPSPAARLPASSSGATPPPPALEEPPAVE